MIIRRNHSLGTEEARRRIEEVASDIASRFDLSYSWQGDNLGFRGRGVDGNIEISDDSVEVHVKLGFALMMLQGAIRHAIENSIDEHINQ